MRDIFTVGGIEFNTRFVIVVILCTILPMLDWYRHSPVRTIQETFGFDFGFSPLEHKAWDRMVFYFLIPVIALILFGENPFEFFKWGNWRQGLLWTIGVCVVMSIILWYVARTDGMMTYYGARLQSTVWREIYVTGLDLFSWEFIWRSFMLVMLAKVIGIGPAIWIQAIPFAFMHLNKPEIETLTTIVGGAAFGWLAVKTDSFWYGFLIHWYIASFTKMITMGVF